MIDDSYVSGVMGEQKTLSAMKRMAYGTYMGMNAADCMIARSNRYQMHFFQFMNCVRHCK